MASVNFQVARELRVKSTLIMFPFMRQINSKSVAAILLRLGQFKESAYSS